MKDIKWVFEHCGVTRGEFFYAVKVKDTFSKVVSEYGQPETLPGTSMEKSSQKFNHTLLADFAKSRRITDVQILMWEYAHLAHRDCDRSSEISKQHDEDHIEHIENARKFLHFPDRKRAARNAVDVTRAAIYAELKRMPNIKYIENESLKMGEELVKRGDFQSLVGQAMLYLFNVVSFHKFKFF
ncbi:Large T antigen, partial [Stegodyphus mimosarum]